MRLSSKGILGARPRSTEQGHFPWGQGAEEGCMLRASPSSSSQEGGTREARTDWLQTGPHSLSLRQQYAHPLLSWPKLFQVLPILVITKKNYLLAVTNMHLKRKKKPRNTHCLQTYLDIRWFCTSGWDVGLPVFGRLWKVLGICYHPLEPRPTCQPRVKIELFKPPVKDFTLN